MSCLGPGLSDPDRAASPVPEPRKTKPFGRPVAVLAFRLASETRPTIALAVDFGRLAASSFEVGFWQPQHNEPAKGTSPAVSAKYAARSSLRASESSRQSSSQYVSFRTTLESFSCSRSSVLKQRESTRFTIGTWLTTS